MSTTNNMNSRTFYKIINNTVERKELLDNGSISEFIYGKGTQYTGWEWLEIKALAEKHNGVVVRVKEEVLTQLPLGS